MSRLHHLIALTVGVVLVVAGLVVVTPGTAEAAAPSTGRYFPVASARVFSGTVGTTPKVVSIAGTKGVPAGATAVVLNVEVDSPTRDGYVRVTPAGSDPSVATQEFRAGRTISNLTTVKLSGGKVQTKLSAGSATVHFDVSGYYGTGAGSTYTPLDAARVFAQPGVGTKPVAVPLAGHGGVPDDATAVALNVGVEQQTAAGYVRVTAAGQDPSVATQVYQRATPVSNLVVVGLSGGSAQVKVSKGTATVYMDVVGYYSRADSGSVFVPIDTVRVATTTVSTTPRPVRVTGLAGVPGTATAVVANVEVSAPTVNGYVRVTPAGQDARVATQNHVRGQEISALTMPKVVGTTLDRRVQAKVSVGTATLFVDVSGYFLDGGSGSGIGADISWPQCASAPSTWPADPAFAIVGVTGGKATTTNPCLAQQLAWASTARGGTSQAPTQLYVNTANPGQAFKDDPSLSRASWPTANRDPDGNAVPVPARYGVCAGGTAGLTSLACSYVYGWNRAYEDVHDRGVPAGVHRWWLDAETDGSWQSSQALNRATLEGMTDLLRTTGGSVGVYSSPGEWTQLMGTVPSSSQLYTVPTWRAIGPSTLAAAQAACATAPFTAGGRTELVQYVSGGFDRDVSCV
ncbi:hypothetical protein [Curtobacterium sp. MCBD17_021]|uniref:hypothetical protein n=1 Tax=Curtobacterium sp. MCBD17_021 TaxID=2175665 RepID=UPI000DA8DD7D|nr:hypothetical protein [Curtobacterium sp. MCBD17_021]PZE68081.1 hypothetical protein DEI83_03910 [Curtobacterium sp. MCBD17_021]